MAAENTARRLRLSLGAEAAQAVALCLEDCRRTGDEVATGYWSDVAARLEGLTDSACEAAAEPPADNELTPAGPSWILMQRIERYRHRAMQAARQVAGSESHQAEMIDIVLHWLSLARQIELLTKDASERGNSHCAPSHVPGRR